MCGIAGVYDWTQPVDLRESVVKMTACMARRGPDGEGIHAEPGLALGHRRLSIIDLTERGAQPMENEDGSVWLTFNGEIYNHRDLRRQLEDKGHRFRSDADSEVLIHSYEENADDLDAWLRNVGGMFGLALWDRRRGRLVLARDRLGIKPLFYFHAPGWIAFASTLDALTAYVEVPRRLDWTSLYEYLLLLTVPGPQTVYKDVRHLPPGHLLVVEHGRVKLSRYWALDCIGRKTIKDPHEADETIQATLAEAINSHLVADVEVGAFLSGGVDSGLVCALAAKRAGQPLRTFSATFPGEPVDEGEWAKTASQKLGTAHSEFALTGGLLDDLDRVATATDQPMALTSAFSLYQLSRQASQSIKVVLTGDGGDEVFAGYNRHRLDPVAGRVGRFLPRGAHRQVGRLGMAALPGWAHHSSRWLGKAAAVARALSRSDAEKYLPRLYVLSPEQALNLLTPDARPHVDLERYSRAIDALFVEARRLDPIQRKLYVDLHSSLADEMLSKVDRMTMAWGLEARVPLLDHRVVEAGMRVNGNLKIEGSAGKLPLRRLVGRELGDETATRPKCGFNSPLDAWMRAEARTRASLENRWPALLKNPVFSTQALSALRHRLDDNDDPVGRNLFSALVYDAWATQRGVQL